MQLDVESTLHDQVRNLNLHQHNIAPTQINIPAGIRHGESIRYPVKPLVPDNYNITQINVQFIMTQHAEFQLAGEHIVKEVTVNAFDAMLGTDITVNTLDGKTLKVKLPAGSPFGTKLKIPNNGLYIRQTKSRGDMYVVVHISIPALTTEERETITKMRETIK